jgi:hypothetical protein
MFLVSYIQHATDCMDCATFSHTQITVCKILKSMELTACISLLMSVNITVPKCHFKRASYCDVNYKQFEEYLLLGYDAV